jgi:hypothetical protein
VDCGGGGLRSSGGGGGDGGSVDGGSIDLGLAMLGFVSVGSTPQTTDIFCCQQFFLTILFLVCPSFFPSMYNLPLF